MKIKYNNDPSPFYDDLKKQVDTYFAEKGINKYANLKMFIKASGTIFLYLGSYIVLLLGHYNLFEFFLLEIMLGIGLASVFLNIGHDAAHNTFFKKKQYNKWLLQSLNLVGLSPYIFNLVHNKVHHIFTSIEGYGYDVTTEEYSILRLSRKQEYKRIHKYQVYYAPLLYCFFSLFFIFSFDFVIIKRKKIGNNDGVHHSPLKFFSLLLNKIIYVIFLLVIPFILIDYPYYLILSGVFISHIVGSLILSIVGVLNHQIYESVFPSPDSFGRINKHKKEHELEVTIDFSPYNRLAGWFFGGFNTHVAHHLFPEICHIHYVPITKMIECTALKYGLVYKQKSLPQAIKSHFEYLKFLSSPENI